jgi:myosin heavy subunit
VSGFTDLRLNHRATTDEGFWPSFTDIMTVIVMIFLMGLVVVLIRHMELTSNLQSALEAEQRASALARTTRDEKIIIDHKLTDTEEVLAQLRMQLLLAQDRRQATEQSLAVRDKSLAELQQTHESLISRQKKTEQDLAGKQSELTKLSRNYSSLQENQRTLSAEAENTRSQLDERTRALASLETQYGDLQEQKRLLSTDLESLRSTEQLSSEELAAARKSAMSTVTCKSSTTSWSNRPAPQRASTSLSFIIPEKAGAILIKSVMPATLKHGPSALQTCITNLAS